MALGYHSYHTKTKYGLGVKQEKAIGGVQSLGRQKEKLQKRSKACCWRQVWKTIEGTHRETILLTEKTKSYSECLGGTPERYPVDFKQKESWKITYLQYIV